MFLYGPPGNGKTVIAEGMGRALGGDMYMPHAIDVDGHIITMFDPITHESLDADDATPSQRHHDRRRAIAAGCASGGRSSWSAAS